MNSGFGNNGVSVVRHVEEEYELEREKNCLEIVQKPMDQRYRIIFAWLWSVQVIDFMTNV